MIKKYFFLLMILVVTACGGDDVLDEDKPVIGKAFINVTPNLQLLADGQVADLRIEANSEWTITKADDWLTVTPMTGSNTQSVAVTAGKNPTRQERSAILTISSKDAPSRSVVVTQLASSSGTQQQDEPAPDDNLPPT